MKKLFKSLLAISLCAAVVFGSIQSATGDIKGAIGEMTDGIKDIKKDFKTEIAMVDPFTVPPLPYAYTALEPYIDGATMKIHHDKHHAAYVTKLNEAIAKHPELKSKPLEDLLKDLTQVPEDIRKAVQNQGGGHLNHSMFWTSMAAPQEGREPQGKLAEAIAQKFGSFAQFQQAFETAGISRFGSGWVWLVKTKTGTLDIITTPNQDTPISEGATPILGNDLWEHAYYLKYQNRRPDYLKAWWNVVNWPEINKRFEAPSPS